jgi:hypothetical protein
VELKAESVAHQLSLLLAGREFYDYPALQKDKELREIATQNIYAGYPEEIKAGYIAVMDNSGYAILHPNPNIEGHNLGEWKDKFPAMWEMAERSFLEDEVSGAYNFFDEDSNETRQKYMVIYRVKGTPFSVYATVYIDKYFKPVHRAIQEAVRAESLNAETRI